MLVLARRSKLACEICARYQHLPALLAGCGSITQCLLLGCSCAALPLVSWFRIYFCLHLLMCRSSDVFACFILPSAGFCTVGSLVACLGPVELSKLGTLEASCWLRSATRCVRLDILLHCVRAIPVCAFALELRKHVCFHSCSWLSVVVVHSAMYVV